MFTFTSLVLSLKVCFVLTYTHQKPLEKTLWREKCKAGSMVLNDCNWCTCNVRGSYVCKAVACNHGFDKFSHMNEAIDPILVGMEGKGAWRSGQQKCEPGVMYRRSSIVCICSTNGQYTNQICEDIFKSLEKVVHTNIPKPLKSMPCQPGTVYLMGCNYCTCPYLGMIDLHYCTPRDCKSVKKYKLDWDFLRSKVEKKAWKDPVLVFAECELGEPYQLGCQRCTCLRNNRLICSKCSSNSTKSKATAESYCNKDNAGSVFIEKCNRCICNDDGTAYCTVKKCLELEKWSHSSSINVQDTHLTDVTAPIDDQECKVGTKYKKDCNTCICVEYDGRKVSVCTLRHCSSKISVTDMLHGDCVPSTVYEVNCLICHCGAGHGPNWERCHLNPKCVRHGSLPDQRSKKLDSLHGYCEPQQVYQKGCNSCRCLSDSRTVACSTHVCKAKLQVGGRLKASKEVDIVPVKQDLKGACQSGDIYKLGCNTCYCLANGNAVCTMIKCAVKN